VQGFNWFIYNDGRERAYVDLRRHSLIEWNSRCFLIGRMIFCQNIFHPTLVACISFFLAELNFSKTSILSVPGSIFHQTISPSTSRSLIPSVTLRDISIFFDISLQLDLHTHYIRYTTIDVTNPYDS